MAIFSDWHYVPGSARKFVTAADGTIFTRQQAENRFAQSFGFKNENARKRAFSSEGFNRFMRRPGYERGLKEAKESGHTTAEANAAFARYYANQDQNGNDRSPDGPLAQMLVVMGRRSASDTYPVGDSPSIE